MMASAPPAAGTFLNVLLDEMCRKIQLTHTQFQNAREKYEAVSDWLCREGSPFHGIELRIFPQGSVAIGTTTKPQDGDEHDVDLVLLLHVNTDDAMAIYEAVKRRLEEHEIYSEILEEMNRCLRLNYANEFHLDILPARPDLMGDADWILVPDKELKDWSPSNPEGFADWFLSVANAVYAKTERETEPLPEPEDADAKAPLQRAVQLLKRRRDVYFDASGDGDDAARSVVLTTLAGKNYGSEHSVAAALAGVLDGIQAEIAAADGILQVPNPSRPDEDFSESWDEESYARFVEFIHTFRQELQELQDVESMSEAVEKLEAMFGEGLAKQAMEAAGPRFKNARSKGTLRAGAAGIAIGARAAGSRTPKVREHNFYGGG